jgi:hypothetical protein
MTEPLRPSPGAQNTEFDASGQLDPTLAGPGGHFVLSYPPEQTEVDFGAPEKPGELGKIGRIRILKRLGKGGMGAVYLGYDDALDRKVALKVMLPQFRANCRSRTPSASAGRRPSGWRRRTRWASFTATSSRGTSGSKRRTAA